MSVLDNVREVLKNSEEARNCDKELLWQYYLTINKGALNDYIGAFLLEMPSFESITRYRRTIQYKEGLYKSDKQIEADRRKAEQNIREGYAKENRNEFPEAKWMENQTLAEAREISERIDRGEFNG